MIYIDMLGRTGNQMFSYSFARWLQFSNPRQMKEKIAFDFTNSQFNSIDSDIHELNNYVCNSNIIVARRELHPLQRFMLKIFYKGMKSKILCEKDRANYEKKYKKLLNIFGIYMCSFNYYKFNPRNIFKNNYVIGWYESADFFKEISNEIEKDFLLTGDVMNSLSLDAKTLLNRLEIDSDSVCINVRRGDFYSDANINFCAVCGKTYYEKAATKISEKLDAPHFYVFSDDIKWAEDNLNLPSGTEYIDNANLGLVPSTQMYIMTKCKNFIISNSTYSWWAQHLGVLRNGGGSLLPLINGEILTKERTRQFMRKIGYC